MASQVLDPVPQEALARIEVSAAGSWVWASAVAVHLVSGDTVLVRREVGMLGAAAAALVAVLRSFDLAEVVG